MRERCGLSSSPLWENTRSTGLQDQDQDQTWQDQHQDQDQKSQDQDHKIRS